MIRRYELTWEDFQDLLLEVGSPPISQAMMLDFALSLFHQWKLAPATISSRPLVLSHPLKFGFGVVVDPMMRDAQL